MVQEIKMNSAFKFVTSTPRITSILGILIPIAWVAVSVLPFVFAFSRQPGLGRNIYYLLLTGCLTLGFITSSRLPAGIDWLWAFLCVIGIIHQSAGLLLEPWVVPVANQSVNHDILYLGLKLWGNPRRLRVCQLGQKNSVSWQKRLTFVFQKVGLVLLLGILYLMGEAVVALVLYPLPMKWRVSFRYYFGFKPDHPVLVRAVFCVHWAWESFVFLTIGHAILAILFVGVLGVDIPSEWPWLWGSPGEVYNLQRFWGIFWHKIGSVSQLEWGRYLSRRVLELKPGSPREKVFLAFFIFMASAIIHALVSWSVKDKSESVARIYNFSLFLIFNFLGTLGEYGLKQLLRHHCPQFRGRFEPGIQLWRRLFGFLWVFLFFFCTLPPWEYPYFPGYANQVKVNFNVIRDM
ncbi:hypothetical protein TRV_07892 [Trichophyton verrucosum HKI 0517]|uniref:Wax synthase domain-containing protein n=1 Tax=Trichophyton verrucosum (strain HKI 0517) TaxID=663202 RepID=D4DL18_TRIVH|nr:uncharacterized protein TRV_07892 [Trichophyton verrucosum HKI 0517]EFE37456.1 hypothetical protein TRV_07892 [Trichophyton verrucosum HKI 0517]